MARITVEDCLTKETNRFALVLLAAQRTKQLLTGAKSLIEDRRENKAVVSALREIAAGKVRFKTEEDLEKERQQALREREARLKEAPAAEPQAAASAATDGENVSGAEGEESGSGEVSSSATT